MFYYVDQDYNNPKLTYLKRLFAELVHLYYKDLCNYIKNPQKTEKFLKNYDDSPEEVIKFWEKNAYGLLCFIVGAAKAQKVMQKVEPEVKKAKKILNARKQTSNRHFCENKCSKETMRVC